MNFSELLQKYHERSRLNKTELAKLLDKHITYILQLEKGKRPPPFILCKKMVDIFKLNEDEKRDFYAAAICERTEDSDKLFFKEIGITFNA